MSHSFLNFSMRRNITRLFCFFWFWKKKHLRNKKKHFSLNFKCIFLFLANKTSDLGNFLRLISLNESLPSSAANLNNNKSFFSNNKWGGQKIKRMANIRTCCCWGMGNSNKIFSTYSLIHHHLSCISFSLSSYQICFNFCSIKGNSLFFCKEVYLRQEMRRQFINFVPQNGFSADVHPSLNWTLVVLIAPLLSREWNPNTFASNPSYSPDVCLEGREDFRSTKNDSVIFETEFAQILALIVVVARQNQSNFAGFVVSNTHYVFLVTNPQNVPKLKTRNGGAHTR